MTNDNNSNDLFAPCAAPLLRDQWLINQEAKQIIDKLRKDRGGFPLKIYIKKTNAIKT